jgi:hypothetical protein
MTAALLVACSAAGAEPASRGAGAPPAGWTQLSPIAAAAAAAAKAEGVTVDAVDAWGEPALGCYAVWLALHGGTAGAAALADQVLGSLPGVSLDELAKPGAPDGVLAFAFARPPYRGRVRAQLGDGRIAVVACFGNHREPIACEAACTRVLEGGPGAVPRGGPGGGS